MKSWRNCFSGCRAAQARRKATRTFNGRLRTFLSIFQHQRKQLRQERASTLFAYFPKEKIPLATGAPGKKDEKKNQQRAGGVFFSLRKNARSHDGNFAVLFGKQAAPPRTTGHSLSPSFMRPPMGCVGEPCPSNTANGEALTTNSTVGPKGVWTELFEPLKQRLKPLILNASWLIPRR